MQSLLSQCHDMQFIAQMSPVGATQVSKLRPVDVLNHILQQDSPGKLEQFFACYGAAEASAMCYFVASSNTRDATSVCLQISVISVIDCFQVTVTSLHDCFGLCQLACHHVTMVL